MDPHVSELVIDPQLRPGLGLTGPIPLEVPGARPETLAAYRHASRGSGQFPRDVAPGLPITLFTTAQFRALEHRESASLLSLEAAWARLRERHPGWSGWITFSGVGFSPSGDQALLEVGAATAGLSASYHAVLLEKRNGTWEIVRLVPTAMA
jgi:hypothetical protein